MAIMLRIMLVFAALLGTVAAASDKQAFQTYRDAEALLEISDDLHRLITLNNAMTEEIQTLVKKG